MMHVKFGGDKTCRSQVDSNFKEFQLLGLLLVK